MSEPIVLVSAKRSPFGKYLGSLSAVEPVDLAGQVGRATLTAAGTDLTNEIDQVFVGNCIPASFETGSVTGRQVALKLGIGGFATTFDTACCSPLTALRTAIWGMRLGELSSALVMGLEMMSRAPHIAHGLRGGVKAGAVNLVDPIYPIEYRGYNSVAADASDGAAKYGITRHELDTWALGSHRKWAAAARAGRFDDEIVPIRVKRRRGETVFGRDEFPRPDSTLAKIAALPPVFGSSTTTAGNAPGLNDGCSAAVVMTAGRARELGLEPLVEIVDASPVTAEPAGISWIPALAIQNVLKRAGKTVQSMDLIEINEAFAAMPLVSTKILAGDDEELWLRLLERTNVNGGAVAIGHPVGASGLRITMTLAYELRRRGARTGVAAICGGLSQGEAVLVRVPGGDHA